VVAVIPDLLWIVGFYVAAATIVHFMMRRRMGENRRQYVLVAGNHQMQIEWYVRALQQFSRKTGTDIGITVVLENSSDETGRIVDTFARHDTAISVVRREPGIIIFDGYGWEHLMSEHAVWVELAREEDVSRLPL
jgi:hypothetical protein